jgi:hypothetical protein
VVCEHAGRIVLLESEGLFPVALAESWRQISAAVEPKNAFCFVPQATATPALLRDLHETGWEFVAHGERGRGERWKAVLASGGVRLLTNAQRFTVEAARRHAESWVEAGRVGKELLTGLFDERRLTRAEITNFETSIVLGAALALGNTAWVLSQADEKAWRAPHPLLTFERFGSLSGRVTFTRDRVEVVLPLGPRFRDLRMARLLEDVPRVPWLGGRRVTFRGG